MLCPRNGNPRQLQTPRKPVQLTAMFITFQTHPTQYTISLDSQKRSHQELQGKTEEIPPWQVDGGFRPSGMCPRVSDFRDFEVSFRLHLQGFTFWNTSWTLSTWRRKQDDHSKRWQPLTQRDSVISQKTEVLYYTNVNTPKFANWKLLR